MARKLIVEVIADAAKFIAGMELSSKAVNGFSADVEKVSVSTELAAKAQVAAAIKTTESLKAESIAYHQLAASAVKGSQEQIAAANLAAAADRKLAASMGLAAAESAKFSGHATGLSRDVEHMGRGLLSGSGLLHGFGRSLAFASGGFLAFEGVSKFLTDSISVARDSAVSQRQLAAQMKASGDSFTVNREAIEKSSLSLAKFGFTSEDAEHSLTVLERGTGNIRKALSLQAVSADLARAKNITLATAANVVAKVFGGQETALRRAVPGLDKTAHGWDLIRLAQAKLAGQAKAATTPQERFAATLHDTERIVGTALLPTLNRYLESLGKWLQKMNESGRLQKDVNTVVKDATGIIQALTPLVKGLAGAFQGLGKAVGGTENAVKLLVALFAGFKTAKIVGSITAIGTSAEKSSGKVGALRTALAGLRGGGPIAVAITVGIELLLNKGAIDKALSGFLPSWLGGTNTTSPTDPRLAKIFPGLAEKLQKLASRGGFGGLQPFQKILTPALAGLQGAGRLEIPSASGAGVLQGPLSAAQQRAIGLAGDPNNLKLLRAQAAHDQAALDFAKKLRAGGRISNAKYVEEVTAYASDLQQTNSTITGILQAARQKVADAAKAAAAKAAAAAAKQKQAAQDAAQKAQEAQQNMLDALQFNVDKSALTKTLQDDLDNANTLVRTLKELIRTRGSTLDLQKQLLAAELQSSGIQQQIADNRKAAVQAAKDAATQAREAAKQAAADAAQRRKDRAAAAATARDALQFRLLGLGPTGGALVPGVANLRTRLAGIKDAVKGTFLDTSKTGSELDHIAKILSGKFGNVSESVRSAIDQMYKDIRDKLKSHQGDQTKFRHMSSQAFVDSLGLNLTLAQRRAIEARFTTVGARGTVPGGSSGQFTAGVTITGDVHVHGVQDIGAFENQITKRAKARPHTRRGA